MSAGSTVEEAISAVFVVKDLIMRMNCVVDTLFWWLRWEYLCMRSIRKVAARRLHRSVHQGV